MLLSWLKRRSLSTAAEVSKSQYTRNYLLSMPEITSTKNNKVKLAKSLAKKIEDNLIFLEGTRTVVDALSKNGGLIPVNILFTRAALKKQQSLNDDLVAALSKVSSSSFSIDCISSDLMSMISEVETSQGIVASFKRPEKRSTLPPDAGFVVILDRMSDPGNLGSIIRSSWGLNIDAMILIKGCDPYSPKR